MSSVNFKLDKASSGVYKIVHGISYCKSVKETKRVRSVVILLRTLLEIPMGLICNTRIEKLLFLRSQN